MLQIGTSVPKRLCQNKSIYIKKERKFCAAFLFFVAVMGFASIFLKLAR